MDFHYGHHSHTDALIALFAASFGDSEGAEEGARIGKLARDLFETTPEADLFTFSASDETGLIGVILFTRMVYPEDHRMVALLSPVAVKTSVQGQGIGQALLMHGLEQMRAAGAEVAITYGNPDYYGKVGFKPISTEFAPPPQPLQMPHGWLAQSLTSEPLAPFQGRPRCVSAFDDPAYW